MLRPCFTGNRTVKQTEGLPLAVMEKCTFVCGRGQRTVAWPLALGYGREVRKTGWKYSLRFRYSVLIMVADFDKGGTLTTVQTLKLSAGVILKEQPA